MLQSHVLIQIGERRALKALCPLDCHTLVCAKHDFLLYAHTKKGSIWNRLSVFAQATLANILTRHRRWNVWDINVIFHTSIWETARRQHLGMEGHVKSRNKDFDGHQIQ